MRVCFDCLSKLVSRVYNRNHEGNHEQVTTENREALNGLSSKIRIKRHVEDSNHKNW